MGQFKVGPHALCWVHAERLVHKLDTFTDDNRRAQSFIRDLIWSFYRDLKAYAREPTPQRKAALSAEFDRIFTHKTGFVTLDRLLARLHDNKSELLMALERPEIPLNTNGSETTSAAKSPSAKSAAAPAAMPAAIAATPFSASPRPAPSSALPSGIISAQGSLYQASPKSPISRKSSATA